LGKLLLGLKDIEIKETYDSDYDDILNDFYIPVLSNSISYKRLCGLFSSTTLAIAAKGIIGLIKNAGKIKLICGSSFNKEDIEVIKTATITPEKLLEEKFIEDIENLTEKFVEDHVKAFGWLLANGLLEIKIAIPYDNNKIPLSIDQIEKLAIFHQKVGILEDDQGNVISFSGSQNESLLGWKYNIEEFKVFKSWIEHDKTKLEADIQKFEKYWSNNAKKTKVIPLPEAIKKKLIEIKPGKIEELNLEKWLKKELVKKRNIELFEFQKNAIEEWKKNNYMGILEMATGTGKTFTALGCIDEVIKIEKKLITIIATPYNHLIKQWIVEIKKYGLDLPYIIADATNKEWKKELSNLTYDLKIGDSQKTIILTTHNTFSSKNFIDLIEKIHEPLFLIVDEVHGIGAPIRRTGLNESYTYRLGLSATPKRWFDDEGTKIIFNFFKKVVYEFSLSNAIGKYLTEYKYYPYFITLTDSELEDYIEKTREIAARYYRSDNDDDEKQELFTLLCNERQKIVKNAVRKYVILKQILQNYNNISHCIIYCSSEQIKIVQKILNDLGIIQHKFTQKENPNPKRELKGLSVRDKLLADFANKKYEVLVAIKCLDEGVNIPQAKIGIFMCNSGNPREFIQRRGRLLRKYPGKEFAEIYDIIVIPAVYNFDPIAKKTEIEIFKKELRRYKEFAMLAKNASDCLKKIYLLEEKYHIW